LPSTLFFVDGEDVVTENPNAPVIVLGQEKHYIRIDQDPTHNILIPKEKNELLFVQKPYESWGVINPIPYIIRKGLFRNLKFMELMSQKGEYVVGRALEYLFLMKKGSEAMSLSGRPDMVYSEEDLKKVKDDFATFLSDKKNSSGTPTYTTNWDTEIQHLIPDYKLAINEALYAPIEKKILAGLGLVDVITGTSSTRRESILNPKPFIAEIKQGIEDFRTLLNDIIQEAILRNSVAHRKYFTEKSITIKVHASSVSQFIDKDVLDHLRSMYDRGTVSIQTYNELCGVGYVTHAVEITRRKNEAEDKLEELMYPHLVQNLEGQGLDIHGQPIAPPTSSPAKPPTDNVPSDKKGPEKKNYRGVSLEEIEPYEDLETDYLEIQTIEIGTIVKRKDGYYVISEKTGKNLGGPYKTYKEAVKRLQQVEYFKHKASKEINILPEEEIKLEGQSLWLKIFDEAIDKKDIKNILTVLDLL
jgi:hypothetical protein